MSGSLFIVAAPSGAGKSSLVNALLERDQGLHLSVSYTTRAPRTGEVDGRDYHFITSEAFLGMRARGEFLESAEVHGNFYGTSKAWIEAQMRAGRDVLLEIDCQGAYQVKRIFPHAVGIFILPPSMAELQSRLHRRAEDTEEVIQTRLANSRSEIEHWIEYDYIVVNEDLDSAFASVKAIVEAERLRRDRRPGLFDFVNGLLTENPF